LLEDDVSRTTSTGLSPIRVVQLDELKSLERLRPAWRQLLARLEDDSPYLTPEFMLPWMRLVRDRYQYRVLTAWDGDALIGLAPIVERSIGRLGVRVVIRSFPVFGSTPPFDVLIAAREPDVMRAFVEHWLASGPWDVIELANVPSESRTAALLRGALKGTGLRLAVTPSKTTRLVPIATGWPDFLASRPKKLRQNLRRALHACEELGQTRFLRYPEDAPPVPDMIDATLGIIERSWKAPTGDDGRWHEFFRDLMTELATGGLLSWRCLEVKGTPIASLLELDYRDALHLFHIAVDLAYLAVSPGVLVLSDAIREAHERPYRRLDIGGTADYIDRWADAVRPFDRLRVVNSSVRSRLKVSLYHWEHQRRVLRNARVTAAKKQARLEASRASDEALRP
jgi:CelD/BcsL family acetyltransferase involved in cellulose biosynthesis